MDRRRFIQSVLGATAMAALPALPAGDGVALRSMAHPSLVPIKAEGASVAYDAMAEKMAKALARSMMQTKGQVAARVFLGDAGELEVQPITWEELYID